SGRRGRGSRSGGCTRKILQSVRADAAPRLAAGHGGPALRDVRREPFGRNAEPELMRRGFPETADSEVGRYGWRAAPARPAGRPGATGAALLLRMLATARGSG